MTDAAHTTAALTGPLAGIPVGPCMAALKSDRHRTFAFLVGSGAAPSNAAAAEEAGFAKPYNRSAYNLLQQEPIAAAVKEVAHSYFSSLIGRVIKAADEIIADVRHPDRTKMIISLFGKYFGDKTSVDVNVSGAVQVSHTEAAVRDLAQMLELGLPRDRLIEAFGESGLDRYTKLLRGQKVIEHQPAAAGSVSAAPNPMNDPAPETSE